MIQFGFEGPPEMLDFRVSNLETIAQHGVRRIKSRFRRGLSRGIWVTSAQFRFLSIHSLVSRLE